MQQHESLYRVSYADTDKMDRVYYANYLVICERARTEFLRDVGYPYRRMEAEGFFFPVRQCNVRYYGWAEYDDLLVCRSSISRMRHATLTIATEISRQGEDKTLVVGEVELACVNADGKPSVLPEALRDAVKGYVKG
ncbi:MAG: acyl-CoA thioesterase [Planctomycetaceae bacterium]|nr:acyl-CoA thioesterase [Planctomycetaceae bacterium]